MPIMNTGGPNSSMKRSLILAVVSAWSTSLEVVPVTLSEPATRA